MEGGEEEERGGKEEAPTTADPATWKLDGEKGSGLLQSTEKNRLVGNFLKRFPFHINYDLRHSLIYCLFGETTQRTGSSHCDKAGAFSQEILADRME